MDVFIRGIPDEMTEVQLKRYFVPVLKRFEIKVFRCDKPRSKGCAILTIHDAIKAQRFLRTHGQEQGPRSKVRPASQPLFIKNRRVYCSKSYGNPDKFVVSSLVKQETEKRVVIHDGKPPPSQSNRDDQWRFETKALMCGQLDYENDRLGFACHYQLDGPGYVAFTQRTIFICLSTATSNGEDLHLEIPYYSVDSFVISPQEEQMLTVSLRIAPRIFKKNVVPKVSDLLSSLVACTASLNLRTPGKDQIGPLRTRLGSIDDKHASIISSCFTYRILLRKAHDIRALRKLRHRSEIPDSISISTTLIQQLPFSKQLRILNDTLAGPSTQRVPYEFKFQIHKLALNGYLCPIQVDQLYKAIKPALRTTSVARYTESIKHLLHNLPYRGPSGDPSTFYLDSLIERVTQHATKTYEQSSNDLLVERHEHIMFVHKATVTPAGIYLEGPTPEVKNRVLRKYSNFPSHFLSVSFLDEDGELYRNHPKVSSEAIYGRFKEMLDSNITVAGRTFEFLGFSHSSLRAYTCWFMAPFVLQGKVLDATAIIQDLGDFSRFRSPAKCAARIGQAFSQTLVSVPIPMEAIGSIPDVERNGRTFSDGVGTCSQEVLYRVWDRYSTRHSLKPTVLQIRFQGAKGVISLDSRLKGMALRLRPSMVKFEGASIADIEICGSARKPLPMILNQPLIKILEDLGVEHEAFLSLQNDAVNELRAATTSAKKAAAFLEHNVIGIDAQLPWLLKRLDKMGLKFMNDDFIRNVLEVALLRQLREIKYRGRIPVYNGVTLYGIMDETGILEEGEVFCAVASEEGSHTITGNVVVTRSPALHPGDVQCVKAVQVSSGNVLTHLHNVVVFSSKGDRDLPSKLSGGDLDGDLYNIIYEEALYPKFIHEPADYHSPQAVDIGRPVEKTDITGHFLNFMRNDSLGRIATLHKILADQLPDGTLEKACKVVAELHSDAVDFSKTGIPVPPIKIPPYPKVRPDFLASGPRVLIQHRIKLEIERLLANHETQEALDEARSYEVPTYQYYESERTLGKLYRAINEQTFLHELEAQAETSVLNPNHDVVGEVWNYVRSNCALIQWEHLIPTAKEIKERSASSPPDEAFIADPATSLFSYEENIVDSMFTYSPQGSSYVSEVEVFCGNILGRNGAQNKRQREYSVQMREKHQRDVSYTIGCITRGVTEEDDREEALSRSIACFYVGLTEPRAHKKVGALVSFVWVAATVCLKEVDRLLRG